MDILKTAWGDLLNENEKLATLLDEKDARIEQLEAALHYARDVVAAVPSDYDRAALVEYIDAVAPRAGKEG